MIAAQLGEEAEGLSMQERRAGVATGLSLLIPITLSTMAIVLLAPVVPQLMAEFRHVPNADYWVPMVLTTPALCIAVLSIFAGALGDYFGRRRLLIASLAIYGFVGLAPIFLTSLSAILVSRLFVGIAEALIMVTTTTLIGDYFKGQQRDKWLAAQTAVASVSALLFFNLGGILGQAGWRTPFWVYSSALIMLALVLAFTWEPGKDAVPADGGEHHLHNSSWAGFPWRRMAGIVLVTVFGSVLFYTVQIQASSGLAAHGITSPAEAGFLTSIASLGVPIGTYVYGKLNHDRVSRLLFAEFLILGIGFIVLSFASGSTGFLAGCGINQFGAGLLLPTLLVWAMSQLSFEVRGRGTGVWQSAFALGQFLSPIAVTYFTHIEGGLLESFQWLGYAGLAAALTAMAVMVRPARASVTVAA
jgi:MFS family permease